LEHSKRHCSVFSWLYSQQSGLVRTLLSWNNLLAVTDDNIGLELSIFPQAKLSATSSSRSTQMEA
jgi:hypothetical protein